VNESIRSSLIVGGQYNIGHICARQQCDAGFGEKTAIRWIDSGLNRQDYSYQDLEARSNQVAHMLLHAGIMPGDRVFIFLPRSPELYFIFLGILKVQVIAGVLFANFGEEALQDRLSDSEARVIFTKKSYVRKIKAIAPSLPSLEKVFVLDLPDDESEQVVSYERSMKSAPAIFLAPPTPKDTLSLLLYTSGSTGRSKGAQHVHGGILTQAETFRDTLSVRTDDIYWCTADPGWVTGIVYGLIGPLSQGATQIQFGGNFQAEAWLSILESEHVNIWYTSPTALRMLMQAEASLFRRYPLDSLRHIYSVGEPLNPVVIEWAQRALGKEIFDTWWQTETGAIMISNRPGLPVKPGSMGTTCRHTQAAILDETGMPLPDMQHGRLCLKPGWDSMFVGYRNKVAQYESRFTNGYYDTGDMAYRDRDGYYWFVGRADDVINTAGHLVGPFEVESALLEVAGVAEVGVIGAPDEILYEKVVAFLHLQKGVSWSRELELRLRLHVSNRVSSIATPQEFRLVDSVPKNKSGKVMRRVLKAWYNGSDPGDLSTLEE
jgi:acetyl-CoA synthetase